MLVCVVCVFSLFIKNTVQAETAGSGARIILYDEPKLAKFHIGRVVGSSVQRAAEATTETELTDIVFTSSDAGVCSVEDEYWEVTCLKEGTTVYYGCSDQEGIGCPFRIFYQVHEGECKSK